MKKQTLTRVDGLTRRQFIVASGLTWAATFVPLGWSSAAATPSSPAVGSLSMQRVARFRECVDGVWRTHGWHSSAGARQLELPPVGHSNSTGSGAASLPEGYIQISRPYSAMPRRIRYEELSRGIGLTEIRRDFGSGVLQELLEEIRYRT